MYLGDKLYSLMKTFIVKYEQTDFGCYKGKKWRDCLWIEVMTGTNKKDQEMLRNNYQLS